MCPFLFTFYSFIYTQDVYNFVANNVTGKKYIYLRNVYLLRTVYPKLYLHISIFNGNRVSIKKHIYIDSKKWFGL